MKNIVRIECQGAAEVELDQLVPFQGDLKKLTEENYLKFKNEIIRDGFSEPISVWRKTSRGKKLSVSSLNVLNGHQRLIVLKRMREDGWEIPKLPVSFVDAPDEAAAKRKVLSLTSQYGTITEDGLTSYLREAKMDVAEVKESFALVGVDFAVVEKNLKPVIEEPMADSEPKEKGEELPLEESPSTLVHTCPRCGYAFK